MKSKIKTTINYINLLSALLLTVLSIYYFPIQKIGFAFFFISYFIEIILEKKWEKIHFDNKSFYFLVMAFFFLLAFIYFPFEHSTKYFASLSTRRLSILGFAVIGIFGVNNKYKLSYFLNTFVISSIIAIAYLILVHIGFIEFIANPLRSEVFTQQRILHVNSHMMFNFYLNISLISIWYILTRSWKQTRWWKQSLYIGALTVIFGILSISEGRSGFILGILLVLCFILFEVWKRRKMIGIVIGFIIPFILIGIVSQHHRMSEKSLETEPRIFLWKSAISVIKDKPIFGYGISDAQVHFDVARAKFQTEEFRLAWIDSPRLDSHSQYLQTTMEFGIFGLLILLFIYICPIYLADKNRKLFSILLMFLCAYQSVFDLFIYGQFSATFGIIVILILCVDNDIVLNRKKGM